MMMTISSRTACVAIIAFMTLGVAIPKAEAARSFCCTDDRGQRQCGDVLPMACRNRAYTEYNEAGVQVRKAAAPLTEAQQAAKDAEDRKKLEQTEAAEQQRRADTALLSTYADEKDLDTAKERALGEMERSAKTSEENLVELNKIKASLAAEALPFKGKPPFQLKLKIERNQAALTEQQEQLDAKKKEIEETTAKFEGFRKRLQELKQPKPETKP